MTYYLADQIVDEMMRCIAQCTCARVAFDVYYSWFSRHPRTNVLMEQRYGEPFQSGVMAGEEGAAAARAGMGIVEVIDARRANQLYVPRDSDGQLLCPAFGAFAMVVAGTSAVSIPMATPQPADAMITELQGASESDSKPPGLWRSFSLDERLAASRRAEAALDAAVGASREPPARTDVAIVGAGLSGISTATAFAKDGVDFALLEKTRSAGGVWRAHGNPFSRVNSTEPGYRLRLRQRPAPNTNHSHHHEILGDCVRVFEQFGLGARTYACVEVSTIERSGDAAGWVLGCTMARRRPLVACSWVVLCTNRRLGAPRELRVAGEESFTGVVRRGLGGDAVGLDWAGRRVLILGHGPYATENARTALEHGAAHVTFGVRRHGIAYDQRESNPRSAGPARAAV